jgi:hypothetical protein
LASRNLDWGNPLDYSGLHTVAELRVYARQADRLLDDAERRDLINYLAEHPLAGDVMKGTGGVRKLRWRRGGQGKSGGVRVIYYVHDEHMPLYLLTLFGKGDRANLTKAERNELASLARRLVAIWRRRESL